MLDVTQFPQGVIFYFTNVMLGFIMTYILVPGISGLYSLAVWAYVVGFIQFLPLVLIFLGGLSFKELGQQILDQWSKHYISLCVLFLIYSIDIANRNLDSQVAFGTKIGIFALIMILLNVILFLKQLYHYIKGDIKEFPNPMDIIGKEVELTDMKVKT